MFLTSDGDLHAKVTLFCEIWRITLSKWFEGWQGDVRRQDGNQYSRLRFVALLLIFNRCVKLIVK